MAAHFFDIDGTIVNYHTSEWLAGAKERIIELHKEGHQIFFITMRGIHDDGTQWSIEETTKLLKELDDEGVIYMTIHNVHSPRIIHDDSLVFVDQRKTNQKWG